MAEAFHSPCALLALGLRRLQPRSDQSQRGFFMSLTDRAAGEDWAFLDCREALWASPHWLSSWEPQDLEAEVA